jgi:aminoglycoside 6'-N-acetyltransferase I
LDIEQARDPPDIDWLDMRGHLFPPADPSLLELEAERLVADPSRQVAFLAVASGRRAVGFVEVSLRSDYVNGTTSSPVAFVEAIYVKRQFRRQGIARQLCDAAARWGVGKGCTELASDVLLDNTLGHEMHLGVSFEETERVAYYKKSLA